MCLPHTHTHTRRWGIGICYYLNVADDGYLVSVANVTADEMIKREVGMVHEVLTEYDDPSTHLPCSGTLFLYDKVFV